MGTSVQAGGLMEGRKEGGSLSRIGLHCCLAVNIIFFHSCEYFPISAGMPIFFQHCVNIKILY